MNVTVATLLQSQVSLDIEVDSAAIGSAIDRAYRRLSERVNVPGFRKGKAPRAVLEAAVGRSAVLEEAADIAVNDAYRQALEQTGLEPISQPEIDLQGTGLDPSQPLFFTAKFYVQPAVELGDYGAIRIEPPKTTVTDEDVDAMLTRLAESQTPWEPVEDRPAEAGDLAILNLKGMVDEETLIDQQEQEQFLNPEGTPDPTLPDLTPHILGMAVGEYKDFDLPLPEGFEPAQYAGKTMRCHAELARLERKAATILDDAFAQSVGNGEYDSIEALRTAGRASMESQQRLADAETFVEEVTRRAVDEAGVELPPPLVEEEIHRTLDNFKAEIEGRQSLTLDLYLRMAGKTMEDLHEEVRGPSEQRVKSNLVLEAIAAREGIEAPRAQVDAEVRELATHPTVKERDRGRVLTSPVVRGRIEERLKRRLALQRLLEIANPTVESADTSESDESTQQQQQVLQQAAESHADALESPTVQPTDTEEEI